MHLKSSLCCLFLLFIGFSCVDSKKVFHEYQTLPLEGLGKREKLLFAVDFQDSLAPHELRVLVRNSVSYHYQDLHLFISYQLIDSITHKDTLTCVLSDQNGKWRGAGWGTVFQTSHRYKQNFIPNKSHYCFEIQSGMSDRELTGIVDIGLSVERQKR